MHRAICTLPHASAAMTASEEFDKLCFEYGIELDEDVRDDIHHRFGRT